MLLLGVLVATVCEEHDVCLHAERREVTVLVDKSQYKHVTTMGTVGKQKVLFPEEVLFLCGLGCARVKLQEYELENEQEYEYEHEQESITLSNSEMNRLAWELSFSAEMRMNDYVAYSHLKRLGYVVRRFGTTAPPPSSPSPPPPVDLISYEVWKPEGKAKFRKTPPDFYLVVCGMSDAFPGAEALCALAKWCQPRELKIGIVSTGDVAFISAVDEL